VAGVKSIPGKEGARCTCLPFFLLHITGIPSWAFFVSCRRYMSCFAYIGTLAFVCVLAAAAGDLHRVWLSTSYA